MNSMNAQALNDLVEDAIGVVAPIYDANWAPAAPSAAVNFACWVQVMPLRTNM